MGWVRLDDDFYDHPKFAQIGPLAELLYMRGLAWSNRNLTDGFIPHVQGRRLADYAEDCDYLNRPQLPHMLTDELEHAHLWEPVDGGWRIHDYLDYQPSADEIQAKRLDVSSKRRAAGRIGGLHTQQQNRRSGEANKQTPSKPPSKGEAPDKQVLEQNSSPNPNPNIKTSPSSDSREPLADRLRDVVLRTENGTGTLPTDHAFELMTVMVGRLAAASTARSRDAAARDAAHVVAWAGRFVDPRIIDEAIGWAEQRHGTPNAIRLPRAVAPVIAGKARDAGIHLPEFKAPVA